MNVLTINLTDYTYEIERRDDLAEWLGGTGIAVQLMKENVKKDCDPLSPENVIVFAVGPFTLAYPYASKTVAMFKSPLTENLGESHAGGRSAAAIASAGYRAIVIKGKSEKPIYLVIDNEKVEFKDARSLVGIRSSIILGRIIAENEGGRGRRSIMRIGFGGQRLVRFACVTTETYRHFGRLGLGAVFGSKNLLGLVVKGIKTFKPVDPMSYRKTYEEILRMAIESDAMKKYYLLGTPVNVLPLSELKALPVKNLTETELDVEDISGESLAEHSLGRRIACSHCPTACIHIAALREEYERERYFYKTLMISYDYELIYALGSMIGVNKREDLLKLIHKVETYGLDAISTGVCLAWATEAYKRGLITENETLIPLEFGNAENYLKAIDHIVYQPNDFYKSLAQGAEKASEIYGGKEFAMCFGKNEMPGYNTGYASYIGLIIGLRHSHLDNAGYSIDQKFKRLEPEELVDALVKEEWWRQVLSSLVVCFFARGIYTKDLVLKALKPLGIEMSEEDLEELGRKIYFEKLKLKKMMGFDINKVRIPERVFEVETPHGKLSKDYFERALNYYKENYYKKV
mgnify:CR=1 FL=1|uniref:Aldehyde:ferredoxin oxidoreductase n=1 Tax=Geoglobus ahangari TaxID=113653 RepID=A0A7C3YFK0_9EURY